TVAVTGAGDATVYAGTDGTDTRQVFVSTDSGATWAEVASTCRTGTSGKAINSIAADPTVSTTFYAATDAGFLSGSTSGTAACTFDTTNFSSSLSSVAVDPSVHTTVYAGSGPAAAAQRVYKDDTTGPTVTNAAPSTTSGTVGAL